MDGEREVRVGDEAGDADPDRRGSRRRCRRTALALSRRRTSTIVHGNGVRTSSTFPWRESIETKLRLRPVVHVAGRVAEVFQYAPRAMFSHPPDRLARHRHQHPALARRAPSRRRSPRGPARARAPRSRVAMSNSSSANDRLVASSALVLEVRRAGASATRPRASGRAGRCRRSGRSPSRSAHSAVSTPSPQPTSRIDAGAALLPQLVERRLEARHQAPDDRVLASRTCRRCCRSGPASACAVTASVPLARRSSPWRGRPRRPWSALVGRRLPGS